MGPSGELRCRTDACTAAEVAAYLGIDARTVRNLVRRRELPGMKLGSTVRIDRLALLELLRGEWPADDVVADWPK